MGKNKEWDLSKHELLDRTYLVGMFIENSLSNHPLVKKNSKYYKKVDKMLKLVYEIYQDVGTK